MLTLHAATLQLLHKSDESLLIIHKESKLPYYWLRKFSSGEIADPSVNRVQALYEYLTGRELTLS